MSDEDRTPRETAGTLRLNRALADGRLDLARRALTDLSTDERRVLEAELGAETVRELYRSARRRRGPKRGRVVVINGIMGSLLDSIDLKGDADRIWINALRLARGRMAELELDRLQGPVDPNIRIEVAGLHKTYLPLSMRLDANWHVLQHPFDWRADIDVSATKLADAIDEFSQGGPVHIVAHSMGGLVSRRMIQLFPDLWNAMDDPNGRRKGGRLVMLGTPNRGAYIIPLVLSGEETLVKWLARIDIPHSLRRITKIVSSFPGLYQMLPSPRIESGDQHNDLYRAASWGDFPARPEYLALGKKFQEEIFSVRDPDRLVYVAGYDQKTPHRIRFDAPGEFEYQETLDGDGRVPHELGLLAGVDTYWVRESHGALPKNGRILDGIDALLQTGSTSSLHTGRPAVRSAPDESWKRPMAIERFEPEIERMIDSRRPKRGAKVPKATNREMAEVEAALLQDYVGGPLQRSQEDRLQGDSSRGSSARSGSRTLRLPALKVEVIWGDVRKANGEVYCCGHYEDVLPTGAEAALDSVISAKGSWGDERVLHSLTKRGVLRGALGEVHFYPWARRAKRTVAVAGMGRAGTFTEGRLRQLARSLAWSVGTLPGAKTVCTVLIGAGDGGLTVEASVKNLIVGMADALTSGLRSDVRTLRIVEYDLPKARQILSALDGVRQSERRIEIKPQSEVIEGAGGGVSDTFGMALVLAAAAKATETSSESGKEALDWIVRRIPTKGGRRSGAREKLASQLQRLREAGASGRTPSIDDLACSIEIRPARNGRAQANPVRMSYERVAGGTRVAAISDSAVVPQRDLRSDFALVRETIERSIDPEVDDARQLGQLLYRFLVPAEFRPLLAQGNALVFEVDRNLAPVHWEMMVNELEDSGGPPHLALRAPLSRQLKTSYSPPPLPIGRAHGVPRVLVIGDPGDPGEGEDLPGARLEAERVAELLTSKGFDVTTRIGAPEAGGRGPISGFQPASRLEVLRLLFENDYDILHYAGHGDFDPEDPRRVGWLFKDGLLTAAELESLDHVPSLIVANACLSARTSETLATGGDLAAENVEIGLLPSLADEFFRRGVRNYIGTSWEIDDAGAIEFTDAFYSALVPNSGTSRGESEEIGQALLAARQRLWRERDRYACLWAAYQHYGDPRAQI